MPTVFSLVAERVGASGYPALRRLEQAGYLAGEWATVGGRRRRTYRLTLSGRTALAGERSAWREFAGTIGRVLEPRATRGPAAGG